MRQSIKTVVLVAVLMVALIKLAGCSAWKAASADEDADTADKAFRCISANWDNNDPKQGNALSAGVDADRRASGIADLAKTMEADADSSSFSSAQWDQKQHEAEARLATAKSRLAATPMYDRGMTPAESYKKTGSYMPSLSYLVAEDEVHKAERQLALVNELKGQDLDGLVAAADKAAAAAVQAASTVPKCRDMQKSGSSASAGRDLFGTQGARKGPSGGGGGGHPAGGGGGGVGGPEGP